PHEEITSGRKIVIDRMSDSQAAATPESQALSLNPLY
ncbi:hypothetical protein SAMN05216187_105173, partial [Jeotgalicoccus aerolatus]